MKHTHTEGPGSILKSRLARGLFPLVAALLAFALAAPSARAAAVTPPEGVVLTDLTTTTSGSVSSASATPSGYPASKAFDGNKVVDVDTVDEKSGKTIPAAKFPMEMKIDWVRYYRR